RATSRSASNTCTPCSSSTIAQAAPVSMRWCSICDRRPPPSAGRMSPSAASVATTVSTCRPTEPRKSSSTVTIGLLFQEGRNVEIVVVVGIEGIGFDVVAEQLGDARRRTGARHVSGTRAADRRAVDAVESGGDDRDADLVAHLVIDDGAEDDVRV